MLPTTWTIEFSNLDDFLDYLRSDRANVIGSVEATIEAANNDDHEATDFQKRLMGILLEFEFVVEAMVGHRHLILRQSCGEFRASPDRSRLFLRSRLQRCKN